MYNIFFEKFAFYGLDMELEPEPEPELFLSRNRNRNHNFSKVGTGTVKNSYGSPTLATIPTSTMVICSVADPIPEPDLVDA